MDHSSFEYQRAGALLIKQQGLSQEALAVIVSWARQKSPSAIAGMVARQAYQIGVSGQAQIIAVQKAARWLAMIRRDHEDKFESVVNELLGTTVALAPQGVGPQIGKLADGTPVYDRPTDSHRKLTVTDALLEAALATVENLAEGRTTLEVDFGFTIGVTTCVKVKPTEEFVFAQRGNRPWLSRFVKNRQAEPTQFLTMTLEKTQNGVILITAYIGRKIGPEPGDTRWATPESNARWQTHALVWGSEKVNESTITTDVPWYYSEEN